MKKKTILQKVILNLNPLNLNSYEAKTLLEFVYGYPRQSRGRKAAQPKLKSKKNNYEDKQ